MYYITEINFAKIQSSTKYYTNSKARTVMKNHDLKSKLLLYAVTTQYTHDEIFFKKIEQALQSGVTFLQLREKSLPDDELETIAVRIKSLCNAYDVPFIINDNPNLAQKIGADGVHLGQDDMSIDDARKIIGSKIVGISAHNVKEAVSGEQLGADYIGAGAMFLTESKSDTTSLSVKELSDIVSAVSIPVVAIGGIDKENVCQLKDTGISGVAVIGAIFSSDDVVNATKEMKHLTSAFFGN